MSDATPPPPNSPLTPSPKRRRRWLRRLTWFVVLVAALVTAAPFALALKPVRDFVASQISRKLGRPTTIGGASGSWWGGFEVRDVEVRNPEGWQGDPLLSIDRVHVDVKFLKLVTGSIDVSVDVEKPVVTLLRATDGRSNADGLLPDEEGVSKSQGGTTSTLSSLPPIVVRVRNGRVVAQEVASGAGAVDEIDAITLDAETGPDGRKIAAFSAVARRAARGGGDVALRMDVRLSGANEGPLSLSIPTVDLARLSRIVSAATGLEELTGTFEANARLTLDSSARVAGAATATLAGLSARRNAERFEVGRADVEVKPSVEGDGAAVDLVVTIKNLVATGFSKRDSGLSEPQMTVRGRVVRSANGDLAFGSAAAPLTITGRSLSGTVAGSARDLASDSAKADVKAHFEIVLSPTLGRLLGVLGSPDDDLRGTASIDASATGSGGTLELSLSGSVRDVLVGGASGETPFREPAITFGAAGRLDGKARRLTLSQGSIAAGAVSAQAKPGFTIGFGDPATASGDAVVDADFARLTTLKALVPSLDSVRGGKLHAEARLASGDSLRADWSVRADNLAFAPGTLSSTGYVEALTTMRGSFERTTSGDLIVGLAELSSSIASLAPSRSGLRIRLSDAGPAVESPGTLTVELGVLGRAMDKAIGLKSGESLSGALDVTPTGSSTAAGATFRVDLAGRDVRFPGAATAGTLSGRLVGRTDLASKTTTIESATLSGHGIDVRATATIGPDGAGATGLRTATAHVGADLATARPLLGVFLGLATDASLSGKLASDVSITPAGAARTVTGRTTITGLRFVGGRDPAHPAAAPTSFDEPSVVAEHNLTLDASGRDSVRLDKVTLEAAVVSASAGGSMRGTGDARFLDLTVQLDADAPKAADRLRKFMGEGYEDTTGEGRITGQLILAGPTANRLRDLKIDGTLAYQRFSSGGLTAESGSIRLVRPNPANPLVLTLTTTINRGSVRVDGSCDLGRGESPWATKVTIRGIDTSPLLTNRGAGRYLTLVMPAIIPAEASSNVLSGLLDADLDLRSLAIDQPRLADTLSGPGSVRMTQGAVKDSTIFSSLAGDGAGKGIAALVKLAPGVGREFQSLSKALIFQSLASTFTLGSRRIELNPVELVSASANLKFSGSVGFDGSTNLSIPLELGGDAGRAIEPYIANRTIPLKVSGKTGSLRVTPDLSPEKLVQGGLLDKGKDALDGLLGGKKNKNK